MKGDFSFLPFAGAPHYTGVLQQQGRVLLDRDWNEAAIIAARWRSAAGRDSFGDGVLAVPASGSGAFRVLKAATQGASVAVTLDAGRGWVDGLSLSLVAPATYTASYYAPPFQSPQASTATIADGVRDLVVLDVWEDVVNGFEDPTDLIEPALGGPDTTERTIVYSNLKLLRLGPNDDCSAVAGLADDFSAKGRLTVSPAPVLVITGDCPLDAGGGYTGLEHFLYRVEIADADPKSGAARFKWSQWNGGLVGRGVYAATSPGQATVTITANDQMINQCGVTSFYLEALAYDATLGSTTIQLTADASLAQDGVLSLSNISGAWPAGAAATAFFRLWNGLARIADFPAGGSAPTELKDGIRLEFDAPASGNSNYQPGDYWTFPVRASGAAFDPPVWPSNAPPRGVHHHRVALGILNWAGAPETAVSVDNGEIDDCRRVFRPLSNQKICCTYNVGDGRSSHGDFDSIEEAIRALPKSGGEICLLPGVHTTNAVISGRQNVTIKGCDTRTRVIPRPEAPTQPIFTVTSSRNVRLEHLDLLTLGGAAIVVDGRRDLGSQDIEIDHNRVIAFSNAVFAHQLSGANIHHNRIRMIDKRGGGAAIYYAGTDGLIERNDIRLIPALQLPPFQPPGDSGPTDPGDPCADLIPIYRWPRLLLPYLEQLWALPLLPIQKLSQPYKTQSGIQLGNGCERVRVLENTVIGGAGNGVTLGSTPAANSVDSTPDNQTFVVNVPREARLVGQVVHADGSAAAAAQVSLANLSTQQSISATTNSSGKFFMSVGAGKFAVTEDVSGESIAAVDFSASEEGSVDTLKITLKADAAPIPPDFGFLYDLVIERNRIEAMGLSGIGVAVLAQTDSPSSDIPSLNRYSSLNTTMAAQRLLPAPVIGLAILGNHLVGNLLDLFDRPVLALAATQGLGGISLGLCARLEIADNEITRNGVSGANPACGIFVAYGEDVQIARNRIVDNGRMAPDLSTDSLRPGQRGGIVLKLVTSFNLFNAEAVANKDLYSPRPALRVHENLVDQPVGQALRAAAFGPVQCTDNSLSCELSGLSAAERLSGVVYLFDLGGVSQAGASVNLQKAAAAEEVTTAPASDHRLVVADAEKPPQAASERVLAAGAAAPVDATPASTDVQSVIVQRDATAAARVLPLGDVLFGDNQTRSGIGNSSLSCHLVVSFDDLAWQQNQSSGLNSGHLFSNGILFGRTVRATGNRLRERNSDTPLSLFGIGTTAIDASLNQADHCIVATDMNPHSAEVKIGNQILNPSNLCAGRSLIATNLFKPAAANKVRAAAPAPGKE